MVVTTKSWLQSKINPNSIEKVVSAYGRIHSNLLIDHKNYPNANSLSKLIKSGLPKYGMLGVGEGMDSEGSD
tara:strand:- start:1250 stop:1465 length:216 start_codon:yes stop_codon:yes gene_type:complete